MQQPFFDRCASAPENPFPTDDAKCQKTREWPPESFKVNLYTLHKKKLKSFDSIFVYFFLDVFQERNVSTTMRLVDNEIDSARKGF